MMINTSIREKSGDNLDMETWLQQVAYPGDKEIDNVVNDFPNNAHRNKEPFLQIIGQTQYLSITRCHGNNLKNGTDTISYKTITFIRKSIEKLFSHFMRGLNINKNWWMTATLISQCLETIYVHSQFILKFQKTRNWDELAEFVLMGKTNEERMVKDRR